MSDYPVKCYIYDLSNGLARSLSLGLLGKQIDGIWHTGIVVYGKEFFFGGGSIDSCPPGGTVLGQPAQIENLGSTQVPEDLFMEYLRELAVTSYRSDQYHLLEHNCNTFSDEVATFLTGRGIPSHITGLPSEFMSTPFGQMVKPFIDSMSVNPGGQAQPVFSDLQLQGAAASSSQGAASPSKAQASKPNKAATKKGEYVTDPPAANYTADISSFILNKDKLREATDSEGFGLLEEVQEYLTKVECSWALGRAHIQVIDKILHDSQIEESLRISTGCLLQNLLLKEDIVTQFKFDPQSKKVLYKLVQAAKYYTTPMQDVALKALCNVTSDESFRSSLTDQSTDTMSIQSVCDLCIACVLSEPTTVANRSASALTYNLTLAKISDEQAVSLGSAVVQFLTTSDDPQSAKHSLNALLNCMNKNAEVVQFAAVMGLDIEGIAMDESQLTDVKSRIKQKLLTVQS